jgi:hypothetical protein
VTSISLKVKPQWRPAATAAVGVAKAIQNQGFRIVSAVSIHRIRLIEGSADTALMLRRCGSTVSKQEGVSGTHWTLLQDAA